MRHVLPALAVLLFSGWLLHPVLPHEGAHEALAAVLANVTMQRGDTLAVVGDDCTPQAQKVKSQPRINLRCAGPTVGPGTPTLTPMPTVAATSTATPVVVVVTATAGASTPTATSAASTPTATSAALPTATSAALPTATSIPPTPVPPAPVDMHEGVPVCATHDRTRWHPLVERDAAGVLACTYGHEHHDDPSALNDIFGEPGAWYGGQQSISYPWQTASDLGPENALKHEGYKWYVERDLPCVPARPGVQGNEGCFVTYRVQFHALGTAADAIVRFHSFGLEAVVDYQGRRGIYRLGGHLDGGHLALTVDEGGGGDIVCPPLPSNPSSFSCGVSTQRRHSSANVPAPRTGHFSPLDQWYSFPISPLIESFGPIDYADPSHQLFHTRGRGNNSTGRMGAIAVDARGTHLRPFVSGDRVTWRGYYDRGQTIGSGMSTACTEPSIACWPVSFESVPVGFYGFGAGNHPRTNALKEFDIVSPATGRSLIRFPN